MKFEALKETILHACELVPEAYRQKCRNHKFYSFNSVSDDYESPCELMLLETLRILYLME